MIMVSTSTSIRWRKQRILQTFLTKHLPSQLMTIKTLHLMISRRPNRRRKLLDLSVQ